MLRSNPKPLFPTSPKFQTLNKVWKIREVRKVKVKILEFWQLKGFCQLTLLWKWPLLVKNVMPIAKRVKIQQPFVHHVTKLTIYIYLQLLLGFVSCVQLHQWLILHQAQPKQDIFCTVENVFSSDTNGINVGYWFEEILVQIFGILQMMGDLELKVVLVKNYWKASVQH